jgi:hypothetical protein
MRFLLFHRIHPWYIVADRVEADLGIISKLQEKNCLAWANAVTKELKYRWNCNKRF